MALNAPLKKIEIYNADIDTGDISGAMNSEVELMVGAPSFEYMPMGIKINMGLIGPRFRNDANNGKSFFYAWVQVGLAYVPSLITSRHQKDIERIRDTKADIKNIFALLKPCIVNTPLVVNVSNARHVYKGHGEGDTKWKGWAWNLLLVKLVILFIFSSLDI